MKTSYGLLHTMASGGIATLNLNTGNFLKINISLPEEEILKQFHNKVELLFDKIYKNQEQVNTLGKFRVLLPKFLNGQVRVRY